MEPEFYNNISELLDPISGYRGRRKNLKLTDEWILRQVEMDNSLVSNKNRELILYMLANGVFVNGKYMGMKDPDFEAVKTVKIIKEPRKIERKSYLGDERLEDFIYNYMVNNVRCNERDALKCAEECGFESAKNIIDYGIFKDNGELYRDSKGNLYNKNVSKQIKKATNDIERKNLVNYIMVKEISCYRVCDIKGKRLYRWNYKTKLWEESFIENLHKEIIDNAPKLVKEYKYPMKDMLTPRDSDTDDVKKSKQKALDAFIKKFDELVRKLGETNFVDKIVKLLLPSLLDQNFDDKINSDIYSFPLKGGKIINFLTGEIRDRESDDYFTSECQIEYDPNSDTKLAENFVSDLMLDDKNKIEYLQKILGLCLTGSLSDRSFYILYGPKGKNGKTTLMKIMNLILGNFFHNTPQCVYMKSRNGSDSEALKAKVGLVKARLSCSSEISSFDILDENEMKRMTGGDKITGRDLYQPPITFEAKFKCFFPTNNIPIMSGDPTLWERACIINFLCEFIDNPILPHQRKQDSKFLENLPNNIPLLQSFLKWLIEGAFLAVSVPIEKPQEVIDNKTENRENVNYMQQFIDESLDYNPQGRIKPSDLYSEFRKWANSNERFELLKMTLPVFGKEISKFLVDRTPKTNGYRYYKNYSIKPVEQDIPQKRTLLLLQSQRN